MAQPVRTSEHSKCTFQPKWPNHPWLTLGWLKVEQGQNPHKTTWLKLTFGRPQKLYFDLVVRTGWNQCHCECHQIISPTTIHGSKSKLERPRFHENWDNVPINALLTSGSHNFWFDRWIVKFLTFLETRSKDLSRGFKINLIQGHLKMVALEGLLPRKACRGYKRPQAPSNPKKKEGIFGFFSLPGWFLHIFPLFQTQKTHQSLLILPFSPKIQGIVLILFSLVLHFGFGV